MSDDTTVLPENQNQPAPEESTPPVEDTPPVEQTTPPEEPTAPVVNSEPPAPEPTAPEAPVVPEKEPEAPKTTLSVNKNSSRLELENVALTLGIDEKKIRQVAQHEDLWKLVKNAFLAKNTAVSVEEETGEGELMKVTVKHDGTFYQKGKRYVLNEETKQEFFKQFYI